MLNSDQPIKSSLEDSLGRNRFANSLSKAILSHTDKSSLVIGLYGNWGSGKTSLLNLIRENIEKSNYKNKPIIVRYNPWNFADQDQLISQFFNQLYSSLEKTDYSRNVKKFNKKLKSYAKIFERLFFVPGTSKISKIMGFVAYIYQYFVTTENNLIKIRTELNENLINLSKKILFIIDDIDRLPPVEIRQVFQVVKKIADFPNTVYLLAFDKKVVLDAFEETIRNSKEAYLEKIVQVPFEIPPISEEELRGFLFEKIEKLFAESQTYNFDRSYWTNLYQNGIKYLFTNLRKINRYLNTLSFNFGLVKYDVNPVDFLAINAIQVFLPDLYYDIRDNIDLFTEKVDYAGGNILGDRDRERDQERLAQIYNKVTLIPREKLNNVMDRIFPTLISKNLNSEEFRKLRMAGRICISDNFYNYFRLSVSEFDISQEEIKKILAIAHDPKTFKDALIQLNGEGRIIKFLDRLHDYVNEDELIPISWIGPIVLVLIDIGDLLPQAPSGYYIFRDGAERVFFLVNDLLKRLDNSDEKFIIIKSAFTKTKESLYTLLNILHRYYEYLANTKKSEMEVSKREETLFNTDQIEELKIIAREKIESWANNNRLSAHPQFIYILHRWEEWQNKDIVQNYIKHLISTDEGLLKFLNSFVYATESFQYTDYAGNVSWNMNYDELKKHITPDSIVKRVRKIFNSGSYRTLNDSFKRAVQLFLDIYDGRFDYRKR